MSSLQADASAPKTPFFYMWSARILSRPSLQVCLLTFSFIDWKKFCVNLKLIIHFFRKKIILLKLIIPSYKNQHWFDSIQKKFHFLKETHLVWLYVDTSSLSPTLKLCKIAVRNDGGPLCRYLQIFRISCVLVNFFIFIFLEQAI